MKSILIQLCLTVSLQMSTHDYKNWFRKGCCVYLNRCGLTNVQKICLVLCGDFFQWKIWAQNQSEVNNYWMHEELGEERDYRYWPFRRWWEDVVCITKIMLPLEELLWLVSKKWAQHEKKSQETLFEGILFFLAHEIFAAK